jgi:hypothetical protein
MNQLDARFATALSEFNKQEDLRFEHDDKYVAAVTSRGAALAPLAHKLLVSG